MSLCLLLNVETIEREKIIERTYYKIYSLKNKKIVRSIPITYSKHSALIPINQYKEMISDKVFVDDVLFKNYLHLILTEQLKTCIAPNNMKTVKITITDKPNDNSRTVNLLDIGEDLHLSIAKIYTAIEGFFKSGSLKKIITELSEEIEETFFEKKKPKKKLIIKKKGSSKNLLSFLKL